MLTEELKAIKKAEEKADKIQKDAKAEAKEIVEAAKDEARLIIKEAKEKARIDYENALIEGEKIADKNYEHEIKKVRKACLKLEDDVAPKREEVIKFIKERAK